MPFKITFLIPYESYDIVTGLSPEEIADNLDEVIAPWREMYVVPATQWYVGKVSEQRFKFHEIYTFRKSYYPIVIGKIKETDNGSLVHIRMRTPWIATIFTALFLIGISFSKTGFGILGTSLLNIFIYLVVMLIFKSDSKEIKSKLIDWLEVEED